MDDADLDESTSKWEGFSHYVWVSHQIGEAIFKAINAYSVIDSYHAEGATMPPQTAAKARSRILSASLQVKTEMEKHKDDKKYYRETLEKWDGDEGYIHRMGDLSVRHECPSWLFDFVSDIRQAGWELGYLQSGRYTNEGPVDSDSAQVKEMIK